VALAAALVATALVQAETTAARAKAPTVIRVGGPSAPADAKVAIVAADFDLRGALFRVERGDRTVLNGQLTPAAGSAAPWRHAYRADLSGIRRHGVYRVRAAGVVSRPWRVRPGGSSRLIARLLRYFRTNRDGEVPALLHGPSHLNDAVVRGGSHAGAAVDLTGGWMDAGDMIKFSQTTAAAAAMLQAAARLDPANRARLEAEANVGVRWLLKAHPFADVFVTQVGGVVDHGAGFRDPASDDASPKPGIGTREAFHFGETAGSDIAGKVVAALALAAAREANPVRRERLLTHAREWYAAGRATAAPTPALPGTGGFYTFESWRGSMAAGAAALFRATGEPALLPQALAYLRGAESETFDPIGPGSLAAFAAADVCGVLGAPPLGAGSGRRSACAFLREGAGATRDYSLRNAFAPASYFQWGTTGVNAALGAEAALAKRAGFRPGRRIAAGARDFLLGRNAWGASFVAGVGPRSPRFLHHWALVFPPHLGLPSGAVVGGPAPRAQVRGEGFRPRGRLRAFNSHVVYEDRRADYVTSEPAIDYTAASILLLALL
jgi:endoglucanase